MGNCNIFRGEHGVLVNLPVLAASWLSYPRRISMTALATIEQILAEGLDPAYIVFAMPEWEHFHPTNLLWLRQPPVPIRSQTGERPSVRFAQLA